jgi:hypothetical protein
MFTNSFKSFRVGLNTFLYGLGSSSFSAGGLLLLVAGDLFLFLFFLFFLSGVLSLLAYGDLLLLFLPFSSISELLAVFKRSLLFFSFLVEFFL